ncbi:hypothetical protein [Martelella alba]|uniref:KTSC domain-containing protein n=1 Tax=Martelella alba TaxID=2590451 RepID=A0ABY2SQZ3_9HYPH|nr:hypothetical protein [Martelella alba]TKI08640.1 hypothetical protein FCN80_00885 [Martelella alba]
MINVTAVEYQNNGAKRIYHLSDDSVLIDDAAYPFKLRFQFYDSARATIYSANIRRAMKQAVERYKAKWRLA